MIPFFRKIRQKLLGENRVSKYLLYAIGEIVLVVIGILIALSINNWKNYQDDRVEEQVLLRNLKQEFDKNLKELHADHAINMRTLEATFHFLETDLQQKTPAQIDSLVGILSVFASFDPSTGYIDQAISSGKLDLIRSDSLKTYLGQWSGELNDLREDIVIRREHWLHHFLPLVRKHLPQRNTDATHYRPDYLRQKRIQPIEIPSENYRAFTSSLEVDGVVYDFYMNQYYVILNEEFIESYIERVLELIQVELH
jgi:hypothetical protein